MKSLTGPLLKSLIFVLVTSLTTLTLASVISGGGSAPGDVYSAVFGDATSVNKGDDIRMAGVRIGTVRSVEVHDKNTAKVEFTVDHSVALASTAKATIRYRNLVGQRYISLDQGDGSSASRLRPGSTIPIESTVGALDLTMLFNGFQPLFKALNPSDVNKLSYEIIKVFQGEGTTVESLLTQTATLTQTIASKDAVIGEVIDNLSTVLETVNGRSTEFNDVIVTLQQLTTGLAADRTAIGSAIASTADLTGTMSSLLTDSRAPLKGSIAQLDRLATNLDEGSPAIDQFLGTLPAKLSTLGRGASYGSWLNFYMCSTTGRIPVPQGYYGGVGAQPVAKRCQA